MATKKKSVRVIRKILFSFCFVLFLHACTTQPAKKDSIITLIKKGKTEELKERFDEKSVSTADENGNSLLHIAAAANNPVIVKFLLSMNADIEAKNLQGQTPLLLALTNNAKEAAQVLAEHNAHIFAKDELNNFPLVYAEKHDFYDLIINGQTVRQKDADGNTALHYAADTVNMNMVRKILSLGKPETVKNNKGQTPLHLAYRHPQNRTAAEIAASLITAGIEPTHNVFAEFETAALARNFSMHFSDGETLLHIFARKGYTGFIRFLLMQNVPVDVKNIAGSTAMHEAARSGQTEAAELLLVSGANPNNRDASGNTPLHLVMPEASRSQLLNKLFAAGANPNIKDIYGETPLHVAARIGMSEQIITELINRGADVNERNKKGQTPLILAVERNMTAQVRLLVKHGADIHAEDTAGETAFTKAAAMGLSMVQNIITDGNSTARDSNGFTPLHVAIQRKAGTDIIYYLVEKKQPINTRDKLGNTPLHLAAAQNYKEAGEILLANNADIFYTNVEGNSPLKIAAFKGGGREEWIINSHTINAKDGAGNTPLHLASEWQTIPMVLYLLDKGADINARNANNETPLFSAVKSDGAETIRTLLGAGGGIKADINARDFLGNSVLHAAIKWSAYKSAQLLLSMTSDGFTELVHAKNLAGKTVLHEASKQGNITFIKMFLKARANVNASDETGRSPLAEAVLTDKIEAVNLLLQNGASPIQQDMYGRTPLHEGVITGSRRAISLIRSAGGDPLASDAYGKTPLLLSFNKGLQTVDLVLGNDRLLTNSDGDTPLHIAVSENIAPEILQKLLTKGYPVDKRNKNGMTAVLIAVQKGQKENTHLLLLSGADPFIINNQGSSAIEEIFTKYPEFVPIAAEFAAGRTDAMGDGLLHYAAKFASPQTVKSLLALPGIHTDSRNTAGETPYRVAVRWQRPDVAEILK